MTRTEANRLLDRAKSGAEVSEPWITRALQVTGDLPGPDPRPRDLSSSLSPLPSFLNRPGRVMRGAADVLAEDLPRARILGPVS